jgi:aspartate aminotransferase
MISHELEDLLEPLERFESIRRQAVKLGPRLADLSYANPYDGPQAAARATIRAALDEERSLDLQYTPFGGQTLARRAVADHLRLMTGRPYVFSDVILTPGAMAALQLALRAIGEPQADVVIPVPCWLDYPLYVRSLDMRPIMVPLSAPRFDLDVDAIASAVTDRTCAVLLSHPANPTGRVYGSDELEALASALGEAERRRGRPITLIADETHRDFVETARFTTASSIVARTLLVYSFGKYHFIQGQRLGYIAVGPDHPDRDLRRDLVRWTRISGHATPTALMQRAVPALLDLHHPLTWLSEVRQTVVDDLEDAGYEVVPADGTLFLYVRTPRGLDDFGFAEELGRLGLLVLPAPVFHHRGYFRLALTASQPMIDRARHVLVRQATDGR